MFERRLRTFWILLTLTALALVARLIDIQLVNAETYEQLAAQRMTRPVRYLRPPRGGIFDRNGVPLVTDEPASDVSIHFAVLCARSHADCGPAGTIRPAHRPRKSSPAFTSRSVRCGND